jgi:outer membrane protein assembly factor BamB
MKSPSLLLVLLAFGVPAQGADWPQWRGPYRDGTVADARLPSKWPETLPAPKWKAHVGIGYSSPVIANGQVFIMGRDDKAGQEVCFSFDADTGKPLWKQPYASAYAPPDPTAGKGPNSTPTVDRDRVYMLGLGGMFHCLDVKSGRILWKHDLAKEYWGVAKDALGEDAWRPACGATASALVDGDRVILPVGGQKAGAISAFDRKTGKLLWKALDDRSSYASPLLADLAGTRQIVGFTGKRMVGLHAENQKLLWEFPFTAMYEQTIITPVIWKNRVIICGEAKPTTALELTQEGGKITQKTAWQNADLSAYLVTPVVIGDHLLGYDQRGKRLVCLDLASGKTAWTSPRIGRVFASLVVIGKQVLFLSDSGELHVLAADPKDYTPLGHWKVAESGAIWSQLAVVGNRVYIKDKEELACYEFAG